MPKFKVLVTDYAWPSLKLEKQILSDVDATIISAKSGDEEELVALAPKADAILTCWKPVTEAVLDAASKCVMVSRYGVGLDNIAVDHATKLGITISNVPDFCQEEVSDHVMALLLTCARRIWHHVNATKQGRWDAKAQRPIPRLRGQTLGLIGCGNIAHALIPKALGFEMKILAYTPRISEGALAPFGETTRKLHIYCAMASTRWLPTSANVRQSIVNPPPIVGCIFRYW